MRYVRLSSRSIRTAEQSCLSAFPAPDPRYGEVLAARQLPRDQWRNSHKWGRFSRHFGQQYRHHPTEAKSLPLCMGKLTSNGPTAAQRAQAHCAVDYDAVCLSPALPSWRDDDAGAPTAPTDGADGLAARKPASVIGPLQRNTRRATLCCFWSDRCSPRNLGICRRCHAPSAARLSPPCCHGKNGIGTILHSGSSLDSPGAPRA
jgi:hypothetical protein